MSKRFLRSDTVRHLRLGKKRKKLQKWRRDRGRHSKMRRKRFGYPISPGVGYKTKKSTSGLIAGLRPVLVHNISELEAVRKSESVIIARIGARKKLEIIKRAQEKKIPIINVGGQR